MTAWRLPERTANEMITKINELACTNCGMCEKVCPMDVFRVVDGRMKAAYIGDCVTCLQCVSVCPVDAIGAVPGKPAKYNMDTEMEAIKELCGFVEHPMAAETRLPPWMKNKGAGGWDSKKKDGGWDGQKKDSGWAKKDGGWNK